MYATATSARHKFVSDGVGSTPPERLLVMLYDRLLRDLDDATGAIERADVGASHDALTHAQDIVAELHSALDPTRWDGADAMAGLYAYLAELLGRANMAKSAALVAEARSVIAPLRDTWAEAYASTAAAAPVAAASRPAGGLDVAG
ncbi:flagellar export chaperone FliS [Actinomarinicola tropica]|uniref:Flagellar export chaperone FliS n=1 Tax=Actinomarinicola tropica TaxID=2789776 RepID=A0A5Q2RCR0_9ACTN|nr:flagellar export chaperone FliS [Actinomarinicola tropica]QGG94638.1 flagellar export chaperone FliS [Actinomarinicola tropica]